MRFAAPLALMLACGTPTPEADSPALPYPTEGELPVSSAPFHFDDGSVRLGPPASGGRGVSLIDIDDDGWPDATITHSEGVRILRGTPEGFVPWAELALPWPRGVAYADIDDDGDRDLYVSGSQDRHILYRNDGGRFVDVTAAAGLPASFPSGGEGPTFGDLDGDGDLDLFVALGARSQASIARDRANGMVIEQGTMGAPNQLYWNDGGHFRRDSSGFFEGAPGGETFQGALFDADADGDLDIFTVDDHRPDRLLVNDGAGHFSDESVALLPDEGRADSSIMGIEVADFDQDGQLDLFGSQKQGDLLYLGSDLKERFANQFPGLVGEVDPTLQTTGWGVALQDFDNDGDLDLLRTANFDTTFNTGGSVGRIGVNLLLEHTRPPRERPAADPDGHLLVDRTAEAGAVFDRTIDGWGLATGDIDRDGDLDVLIGVDGSHEALDQEPDAVRAALLLINRGAGAHAQGSVLLRVRQPGRKNYFAVGATVEVRGQGIRSARPVQAGQSYLSQHDDALHFGLGPYDAAPAVIVTWPDAHRTAWLGLPAGAHRLERPADNAANCCVAGGPEGAGTACTTAPSVASCLEAQLFALGLDAACEAGCAKWASCCAAVDLTACRQGCGLAPPPRSALVCMESATCGELSACMASGVYAPGNLTGAAHLGADTCPLD